MKIMYVEDNPANLSLMLRIARMGGHDVVSYTEGEVALQRFTEDTPDIVLLDVQLAGALSGLDVVQKLRERGVTLPIIAVTAYAMIGDKERCLEAGFDGYMSKPLPVTELVELVQKYEADIKAGVRHVSSTAAVTAEIPVATLEVPAISLPSTDVSETRADRKTALSSIDLGMAASSKEA